MSIDVDLEVPKHCIGPCHGGPYDGMRLLHTRSKWYLMKQPIGGIDLAPGPLVEGFLGEYRFNDELQSWIWHGDW